MHPEKLGRLLVERLRMSRLDYAVVAGAVGATPTTVGSWNAERLPRGEKLNALWHLLAIAGMDSPEMSDVPEFGRYVGELLALQVISLEDAQDICGVKNPQAVLNTIRGGQEPAAQKFTVEELRDLYEEERQRAIDNLRQQGVQAAPAPTPPTGAGVQPSSRPGGLATPPVSVPAAPTTGADPALDQFILDLAQRLGKLLPALRYMASDGVTQEDRGRLRELFGQRNVFELINALSAINSERVRNAQGR